MGKYLRRTKSKWAEDAIQGTIRAVKGNIFNSATDRGVQRTLSLDCIENAEVMKLEDV